MRRRTHQILRPIVVIQAMIAIGTACALMPQATAADQVVVHLRDGGRLRAEIDGRSSTQQIWLRFVTDSTILLRPIRVEHIAGVTVGNRTVIGEAIADFIEQIRKEQNSSHRPSITTAAGASRSGTIDPPVFLAGDKAAHAAPPKAATAPPAAGREDGDSDHRVWPTYAEEALKALGARRPANSLSAFANVIDWNLDGSPDGLELRVIPRDADGNCIAVEGTLEIEAFHGESHGAAVQKRDRLGRWIQTVESSHVGAHGVSYRLRFASDTVGQRFQASGLCTVAVRLSVPGQQALRVSVTPERAQARRAPSR